MEKQIRNSSTAPSPITQPLKVIMAEPLQIVRFCKEDTGIQPQTKQAIRHHGDCIHKNLKCRNISHDAQVFFFLFIFRCLLHSLYFIYGVFYSLSFSLSNSLQIYISLYYSFPTFSLCLSLFEFLSLFLSIIC